MTDTPDAARGYRRKSSLGDAMREAFRRFADFRGRSNRGEYWWWVLGYLLVGIVLSVLDGALFGPGGTAILAPLWGLVALVPNLAVSVRRLHDIDRTGWWVLLYLIPVLGALVLIFAFFIREPDPGPNRFG